MDHVIPQSIGGCYATSKVICAACNQRYGDSIDAGVRKDFAYIVTVLNIQRERKPVPHTLIETQDGSARLLVKRGGHLSRASPIEKIGPDTYRVFHTGGRDFEAKMKQIARRRSASYSIHSADSQGGPLEYKYLVSTGSETTRRSLTKSAICYYLSCGLPWQFLGRLYSYCDRAQKARVIHPYMDRVRLLPEPTAQEVFHGILLRASPASKLAYAYIELFSSFRYLVWLSRSYEGEEFAAGIKMNVMNGCVEPWESDWTKEPLIGTVEELFFATEEYQRPLHRLLFRNTWSSLINSPLPHDMCGIRSGTIITEELVDQIFEASLALLEFKWDLQ